MAIPIASFNFSSNGLIVQFMDQSSEEPITWAWDFGDVTDNTSSLKNPSHTYPAAGSYTVTLTVTNGEGSSDPYELLIMVSDEGTIGFTIEQMVTLLAPAGIAIDPNFVDFSIKKWQLTLYNSFTPPVDINDVYSQTSYPDLVNLLIANLVIYDLIIKNAEAYALSLGNLSGNTTTGSGAGTKSIKTGPTEVNWYNISDSLKSFFSSAAGAGSESAMGTILQSICGIASSMQIYLIMCGPSKGIVVWTKVGSPCYPCYDPCNPIILIPDWFWVGKVISKNCQIQTYCCAPTC